MRLLMKAMFDLFKIILFICIQFLSLILWAGYQVTGVVDSNEVSLGESVTFSISIKSSEEVDVSEPRIPKIGGFNLENSFRSQSESYQMKIVNGSMQNEKVIQINFNYVLTPTQMGQLTIPGFEVVVNGKSLTTSPIKIQVGQAGTNNPRNRGGLQRRNPQIPGGGQPFDDPFDDAEELFNQFLNRRGVVPEVTNKKLNINPNEAFFILADIDKKEVYEGEQIVANWYLYTRGNILSLDRLKFPELKGFWKEIIEEVPALNFTEEIVNGVLYRKALLASHALFPIKPGTSVIDEYKIKAQVQLPTNPLSAFGYGKPYTYNKSSERVSINVKPLPHEGRPQKFSGAVGQFEVRSQVEQLSLPANQPFSLKIRFEGSGNAKLIELPSLDLPSGIEIYDTKSEAKFFKDGRSYKEFDVLIIPRVPGPLTIPEMEFSTFDPQQKKYVTKKTQAIQIQINEPAPGANPAGMNSSHSEENLEKISKGGGKSENKAVVLELPGIIKSADIARPGFLQTYQIHTWLFVFISMVIFFGFRAMQIFGLFSKNKSLESELNQRFKKIDRLIAEKSWRSVGAELTNCINFILGSLNDSGTTQETHKMIEGLAPSIRAEYESLLKPLVDSAQILSFAPESLIGPLKEPDSLAKLKNQTESLLKKMIKVSQKAE